MLVSPDELITAAQRLATVGSDIAVANLTVATSTTGITPAAGDELSQNLVNLFSTYAEQFHMAVEQTGMIGIQQFAQHLTSAANGYANTDVSSAASFTENVETLLFLVESVGALALFSPILIPVGPLVLLAFVLAPI
ncbi:PE family protein [Mycobacterium malmoense]|uniref:PE domain-containing protein n=1 Tax=Mycobacterium malmoense TaxID=1780 RepID=A0ABX3SMV2_MYCMA|nr:PE family protein [Mycobacterium malmoense]OIN79033.1 hypothetical protein BMG05_20065 [Mycobacterium malmoense]ORA79464.1 hypothetical protein BST29_19195 [Mycobacterium malmoense]QZA16811.1 PE family protein [Mycobacterium malmoense]UNB93605.1 PE family protein [Mycobacterium malmoense]